MEELRNPDNRRQTVASAVRSLLAKHGSAGRELAAARARFDAECTWRGFRIAGRAYKEQVRFWRAVMQAMPRAHGTATDAEEVVVELADGWTLRSSSEEFTAGDYVRLCKPDGTEYCYWHYDEWQDDPRLVMGAIVNAAAGRRWAKGPSEELAEAAP